MRPVNYFDTKPEEREAVTVGDRAVVFVRRNIERVDRADENGELREEWRAEEYSATMSAHGLTLDDALVERIVAAATEKEAESVRKMRNTLLLKSDPQMFADRVEHEDAEIVEAWKEYRQALRDLPQQPGFPFDVEWPEMPRTEV